MKIKEMLESEKPRERLIKYGASSLSNEDLMSIILRCGTKEKNVKELSLEILSKFNNINDLNKINFIELNKIKGMGKVKTITLLAAIELGKRVGNKNIPERITISNTEIAHDYFNNLISSSDKEELLLINLDNKKRLINYNIMYKGTSSSSVVSVKEIFEFAIKSEASAIIIMHNHPSGIVSPSKEDIILTNDLISSGKILGLPLLDHIITNGKEYYSFFKEMSKNEV